MLDKIQAVGIFCSTVVPTVNPQPSQHTSALKLVRLESVALIQVAGLQAFGEPTQTLFAGAVVERFRLDVTATAFLQRVVADGSRGRHGLFDVSVFDDAVFFFRMVQHHSGKEVRLQFQANRILVVFDLGNLLTNLIELIGVAKQVLNVVTDFVSDHVGLSEIPRCTELASQLAEEGCVEINFFIGRAIERSRAAAGHAASTVDLVFEQNQRWFFVVAARLCEQIRPNVFRICENGADKFAGLDFLGRQFDFAAGTGRSGLLGGLLQELLWVAAEQTDDDRDHDHADSATNDSATAAGSTIFHIVTLSSSTPTHAAPVV